MLKEFLARLKESHKRRRQSLVVSEIIHSCNVTVENGSMYLVSCGIPVQKLEHGDSVAYILNELQNMIDARLDYNGIAKDDGNRH